jgi:hypothetical protein
MPQHTNQILYLEVFNLIKYLYQLISNYPKEYKYSLGEETLGLAWKTLDLIVESNGKPNSKKQIYIQKSISSFTNLKYRLRLASELKIISLKSYAYITKQSEEIEQMLRGWLTWSKRV